MLSQWSVCEASCPCPGLACSGPLSPHPFWVGGPRALSLLSKLMPGHLTLQGTTYQKTDAAVEMKRINREQFWEQAKVWTPTLACRLS